MEMVTSTFSNLIASIAAARREIDAQLKHQKVAPVITASGAADILVGMDQKMIRCQSFQAHHVDQKE